MKGNERADALAKVVTEITLDILPISPLHEKSQSRQHLITAWTTESHKRLQHPSAFLQVNRFTPTLKPCEHLYNPRPIWLTHPVPCLQVYGWRIPQQTRPLATEDRSRPCGEPLQLRDHIRLATCRTYEKQRQTPKKASEDLVNQTSSAPKTYLYRLPHFSRTCSLDLSHATGVPLRRYPTRLPTYIDDLQIFAI
ncbi:hypothetical protein SCLCIDRAFT_924867 [Scleroderma citrinum Foug A]|uniref:Uncharacterized protein n=1 Tax=Scleroderma citrinum Foug A TaxID=1036808 RepID=A0A0C3DJP2_9AGAM|nr:hypothetical protein SCLCIDRAFT_924867 [Scleroderma citrinum Foug A]